jgi:molybdopterin/thiamine biosynthesis adenylyltransferase
MNRYAKQVLFAPLGKEGQERLARSRATLIGLGALGSTIANHLVRAGVGFVRLCDRDFVELDNLQRQVLYDEEDVKSNLPKAAAAAAKLARVNSEAKLESRICDVNAANVESLALDVDLVLDGTDNFETRFLINDACVKLGKPWVYGGCVGSYGMVMAVLPGEGPCFACLVGELPAPGSSPTCDTAGVLGTAVGVVASLQANEALKILSGRREALAGGLQTLDVWHNTSQLIRVPRSSGCRVCVRRVFTHLEAHGTLATSLCGRNAVQISPPPGSALDLAATELKLAPLGRVRRNPYLLKFAVDGCELTLFPDARAIIQGTDDPARARSLYSRYVGS